MEKQIVLSEEEYNQLLDYKKAIKSKTKYLLWLDISGNKIQICTDEEGTQLLMDEIANKIKTIKKLNQEIYSVGMMTVRQFKKWRKINYNP